MELDIGKPILARNDEIAAENRKRLDAAGVFVVNVMASPGSGKTSSILATAAMLAPRFSFAVIEGDIASKVDSEKVKAAGIPCVQINTGGICHLESQMVAAALDKLSRLRVKVGYPDRWRDYSGLETRADDPVGNRKRALAWDWRRRVARLGQPTDRDEWGMTPQTVNAYYNAFFNEIVFPAAILQPPYFDPAADPAVNFGGIGGVIGHEMGHAFDDQGAKTDGRGAQRDWWSPADAARFKALTGRLVEQYAAYEPIPGRRIDGRSTLGENIGDNGGLRVALEAYRLSLRGGRAPRVGGFTGEQRFFLSWAQTYREVIRDAQLRQDLVSDPHSPSVFRVNGVVRNIDAWYRAFDVRPGDRLYLAPGARARIW